MFSYIYWSFNSISFTHRFHDSPILLLFHLPCVQIYLWICSNSLLPKSSLVQLALILGHRFDFVGNKPIFSIIVVLSLICLILFFPSSFHVLTLVRASGGASGFCAPIGIGVYGWSFAQGEKTLRRQRSFHSVILLCSPASLPVLASPSGSNLFPAAASPWILSTTPAGFP